MSSPIISDPTLLMLCAVHSFAFGIFHLAFWQLFGWREHLASLSRINRGVMQILNLRLIYVFFAIGALCLAFPQELVGSRLGRAVLLGMSGFWLARLLEQFMFLRIRHWTVHVLNLSFALGVVLFAWPALR